MVFRIIGGVVVYGFALYGVVKLFNRKKKGLVFGPDAKEDAAYAPTEATQ